MPIEGNSIVILTWTGQEGFYWITTSVWTIVPGVKVMEYVQRLVIMLIEITDFLGLPLIKCLLTTTMTIVIHSREVSTILESVAGLTVSCQLPYLLHTEILK